MPASHEWIYQAFAVVIGLIGLWLLFWSLFKDRSRGRRRCPKCWYDMSGNAGSMTCSECGHVTKRERKFFKTRRRWKWAVVAVVMELCVSGFAARRIQNNGVWSIVPNTALIVINKWVEPNKTKDGWRLNAMNELFDRRLDVFGRQAGATTTLWDWQWSLLLRSCLNRVAESKESLTRPWPSATAKVLEAAYEDGLIHRVGLDDELQRIIPPVVSVDMPNEWLSGRPIPCSWNVSAYPIDLYVDVSIMMNGQSISSQRITIDPPGDSDEQRTVEVLQVPDAIGAAKLELTFQMSSPVLIDGVIRSIPYANRFIMDVVMLDEPTYLMKEQSHTDCDRAIQAGSRLHLDSSQSLLAVTFDNDCIRFVQSIGNILRLQVFHGAEVKLDENSEIQFRSPLPNVCAFARFALGENAHEFPTDEKNDDGTWTARWSVDPYQVLLWGHSRWYWPGEVRQRIDWRALRSEAMSHRDQANRNQ